MKEKFGDMRDFQGEGLTRRKKNIYIYNEWKKERKKEKNEKYEKEKKNMCVKWTPPFSKSAFKASS
jgi:hypothetical protein